MTSTPIRRRRGIAITATSLTLAMVTAQPAQAIDRVGEGFSHFIDCAGLMLTAPSTHAENCLPNHIPDSLSSLATLSTGAVPPPPVITPPEPPPPSGPEE